MIKNEAEYKECLARLRKDKDFIQAQRKKLVSMKLSSKEIERAMEPAHSFHEQLKEEVHWYERAKKRDFSVIHDLEELGPQLIALRIANGVSQAELARSLDVDPSLVSRDERNDYHGITLERAQRILNALSERVTIQIDKKRSAVA